MNLKTKINILRIKLNADWKKISAGLIVAAIVVSSGWYILPTGTQATGYGNAPMFNVFTPYTHVQAYNQDYYLLDMKNDTKGTAWNDPIFADPGDVLTFSVYYHNGVNYTTAYNTKIKVNIPNVVAPQVVSTAFLWADNAGNATYNTPFTETGTVNFSSSQQLEFISGSVKWYPNQSDWRVDAPTPFPFGQSGNEIVGAGVNIGDVEGCWEFSGYIIFKVKVSEIFLQPDLIVEKSVRNLTEGQTNWTASTIAKPRQRLAFELLVGSVGEADATNVIVHDALPDRLIYVPGSTRINGGPAPDGITVSGLNVGAIPPGGTLSITFEADVDREVKFVRGDTRLLNVVHAVADDIPQQEAMAEVIIRYNGCSEVSTRPGGR